MREAAADVQAAVGAMSEIDDEQVWFTRSELMVRWQISLSQIKRLEDLALPVWRIGESDKMKRYFWAYVLAYEGRLTREEANRIFDQYTELRSCWMLRRGDTAHDGPCWAGHDALLPMARGCVGVGRR